MEQAQERRTIQSHQCDANRHGREFHLVPPQPKPSQEQQPHDDAEADEPATDPLRAFGKFQRPRDGSRGRVKPQQQSRPGPTRNRVELLEKA